MKIKESLNVTFDKTPPPSKTSPLVDDDLDEEEAIKVTEKKNLEIDIEDETLEIDEVVNIKESRNHPLYNVIGNLNKRTLRSQSQNRSNLFCFISTTEPKNISEALKDKIACRDLEAAFEYPGGSPAGIHGLFSGWYCGLAGRKVTLRVSMAWAKGVTTGTLVRYETSCSRLPVICVIDWICMLACEYRDDKKDVRKSG
ncbi:hypothetical protein Tco_1186150 [Tanacetum coccineum]